MTLSRGNPSAFDPIMRPGDIPSAKRLEATGRYAHGLQGSRGARVAYRPGGKIDISFLPVKAAEWEVKLSLPAAPTAATIYHRPVVFASRRIPAAWANDEDVEYEAATYYVLHAPLSVDLLDEEDAGLGSGFIFVEIDLNADTVSGGHSVNRPVDDPAQSIVRWPLVHITETATTPPGGATSYRWRIDTVLHTGQIKIPALFAP